MEDGVRPGSDGSSLFGVGVILLLIGIAVVVYAVNIQTAVHVDADLSTLLHEEPSGNQVANFSLMQQQMMFLHIGLAIAVSGATSLFMGLAVKAMKG